MGWVGDLQGEIMDFEYVPKEEYQPVKEDLETLIHEVQDLVRDYFTFSYEFIGSSSRNMITRQVDGNIGYDFDINIRVNDEEENYSAKEIKQILIQSFNKVVGKHNYNYCEDSTRVITIKTINYYLSRIIHSCDFCIVNDYGNNKQEYIRFNKEQNSYSWVDQPSGYKLREKEEKIKKNRCWNNVRKLYLYKKCNDTEGKKSRSLYAETINEIYNSIQ